MNIEVKRLLARFVIPACKLKNSPTWEKQMVLDKGFEELSHDSFCELVDLAYPEPKRR